MKPERKDKQEQEREQRGEERKEEEERIAEAAPEDERAFRRRVEAIIDRYRPALKKLAE